MTRITEKSLGVFLLFDDGHEEVDGILAYGFFTNGRQISLTFPFDLWPEGTKVKEYIYANTAWQIVEWTVKLDKWPKQCEWAQVIEGTLQSFIAQGAHISWCGLEGHLTTPPSLFSSKEMSEGVYAILIPNHKLICSAQLQKPFRVVSSDELRKAEKLIHEVLN